LTEGRITEVPRRTEVADLLQAMAALDRPPLDGRPPAMIFTCQLDPLRDQARQYAERLVAAGVSMRYREGVGLVHGAFTTRRIVTSASWDLQQCAEDVKSLVAESLGRGRLNLARESEPALQPTRVERPSQ
jgi:acetyl esterase